MKYPVKVVIAVGRLAGLETDHDPNIELFLCNK